MTAIPHIIVCIVLFYLYLNENGTFHVFSEKKAQNIAFILLLVFIGLRGHIYSDFIQYYRFFEQLPNLFELDIYFFSDWYFEPGYVLYSSILKTILPNYFAWVFVNTLIDLLIFRHVFKEYTSSQILPFIFFIAFNGLFVEFNLYRNVKSIELFLLSIPFLKQRKFLPYMLINLLGMSFHSTSIVYLPLYFVLDRELPAKVRWTGIIVANLIYLGQVHIISDLINSLGAFQSLAAFDKLAGHADKSDSSYGLSFGHIERTASILIFTVLYDRLCADRQTNRIFYNCFWLYYITFLCFYEVTVLTERIPILFVFGYWILYANTAVLNYKFRQIVYAFAMLLVTAKVFMSNNIPPAKYDNVLFGIESYETRRAVYESFADK